MSFLETVRQVRDHLRDAGRVSLKALKREFTLDDEALDELIEELVDIQQVAAREGKAIAWMGGTVQAGGAESVAAPPAPAPKPGAEGALFVLSAGSPYDIMAASGSGRIVS